MKKATIIAALFASSPLLSHSAETCNYSANSGTEFQFKTDDLYQKYGFQMFHASPGDVGATPYEVLAGKKAKVVGKATDKYKIMKYHEVLVEDCTRVYWHDTDEGLDPDDALTSGIVFLEQPATEWKIAEKVDRMTDEKSCLVTPESRTPFPMFHYSGEGFAVGVVGGDFPGKPTTFRVDKNKAIVEVEGLSGSRAQALAAQIRAGGTKLLVGSYKWPNDYEVIREFNLGGLVQQLDYCKAAVRK